MNQPNPRSAAAPGRATRHQESSPVKPRTLLASLLGLALMCGTAMAQSTAARHDHATSDLAAMGLRNDPFAPVHIVTSRKLFQGGIQTMARDSVARRDSIGNDLVIAEIQAHQLDDVSHLIHERERRCGGYFAFPTRAEADAFIRSDRSAQAMTAQLLAVHPIDNQATVGNWLPQVQEANIRATISHLSTAYPNRYYTSSHGLNAAIWIRDTWLALGHGRADVSAELYTGCSNCSTQPSVILTIQGSELPDEIVVLGAHLDSISNSGSGETMNAPGADDDASGIATLTEVIRIALASDWKPRRTVKFMGYAAEEVGLRGSYAIAQSFKNQNKNVVGVLQLDMTNYAAGSTVAMRLITDYSNPGMQQFTTAVFDAYLAPLGLTRGTYTCGYGCSDHASWTNAGYPSAMMFEPTFFRYLHTIFDTLPQMGGSTASSVNFAKLGLAFLGELAKTGRTVRSDFNGDGNSDILWHHTTSGANTIWLSANADTRQLMPKVADLAWKIAGTGDFSGDGKADILWRNTGTGANMIWKSGSAVSQQATAAANVAWKVAAVDDFDGDSHADILWRHGSTGANTIWWAANAGSAQALTKVADLDWKVAGAGDVNGDGRADIVWRNSRTGNNAIWRSGDAANYQPMTGVSNLAWHIVGIGDFDADGRDDVAWRNSATGANVIWRSANAATVQSMTGVNNLAWHIVGIGDYDGDGRSDALWRDTATGTNTIWKSANNATQQAVDPVAGLAWEVSK